MGKKIFLFLIILAPFHMVYSQTIHSLIFINKSEPKREADRTAEMDNMTSFCEEIANALEYNHDLRTHSDEEFTSRMLEEEIANLRVAEGDIVLFYYGGHGINWDDDDWPHMAFLDKQYWETTAYNKLKEATKNAKLLLCIASCCNMDSEGSKRMANNQYGAMDKKRVKKLFSGFNGNLAAKVSSSIRGQYSYSWSSGNILGSVYGISLREVLREALSTSSKEILTWNNVLERAKERTLRYTKNFEYPQKPQHIVENIASRTSVPKQTAAPKPTASQPEAIFNDIKLSQNMINGIRYLKIQVNFETHYLSEKGGRLVAIFERPKGTKIKDVNGKYCDAEGNVMVELEFDSHYIHSSYSDKILLIPYDEIHMTSGIGACYIKIGVFDNINNQLIKYSDYVELKMYKN